VAHGRVRPTLFAEWIDAPNVRFHGMGAASSAANDMAYHYRGVSAGTGAVLQLWNAAAIGAEAGVLSMTSGFRDDLATQRDLDVTYLQSRLFAAIDTRRAPRYLTAGGRYRVDIGDFRGGGQLDFQRREVEVQQFLPLLRSNWTLALRALATTTSTAGGHEVPYALLPALGGQSMRGYSAFRFRDRARVLVTGEYRWAAGPFVEMAAFVDAGTVAPRLADVTGRAFRTAHGIGLIVHTLHRGVARLDLARSREGYAVHFALGPTF
jgi:hypothetical protein